MATDNHNSQLALRHFFESHQSLLGTVHCVSPVSGGCINTCLKLETNTGAFFLKYNNADAYPGMMAAEVQGLKILRDTNTFGIPATLQQTNLNGIEFLLLEWIETGTERIDFWEVFGESLAALHRHSAPYFGLDHNNYIGSLPQYNTPNPNGIEFFIECRLQPQLKLAIDSKQLPKEAMVLFQSLYTQLPNLLPNEPSSLLHGDLWEGNYLVGTDGKPWLVDPSVQYGFREAEIAYTQLFGGFSHRFYETYDSAFQLLPGFQKRTELYNLYPLLVHVNLFGGSYANQVMGIINRYA